MQGLADGYFVLPYTLSNYFAGTKQDRKPADHAEFKRAEADVRERVRKLLAIKGKKTAVDFHREVGKVLWDDCGMARNRRGLEAAISRIQELRAEFWAGVNVPGTDDDLNQALERAGRVADFMEFGELMCRDALAREESCGAHFREEYQQNGECERNDAEYCHVAAWEYRDGDRPPVRHTEPLTYEYAHLAVRSYK
jgi:succinate dehydrogenase / fumarate reductase flavoprotein subunit